GTIGDAHDHCAGKATNVVTDFVRIRGESRSHNAKFVGAITAAYKNAFKSAVKQVKANDGKTGKVKFVSRRDYYAFRLNEHAPVVKHAVAAVRGLGLK